MKGLLLKDWYMMKKYCRMYLLVAVVFFAVALAGEENMFFLLYPCLLCGMMPVTLLAYDERSRWMSYCGTLPYTKAQIVSAKYLIGMISQIVMLTITAIVIAVKMYINDAWMAQELIVSILPIFSVSLMSSAITLPVIFKWGVEKGRIAYYVAIGIVCAGGVLVTGVFQNQMSTDISLNGMMFLVCLVGIGIYVLSWYLSIVFYQKREIY